MKMYIPSIGDKIILSKDWTFTLFNEYRNNSLIEPLTQRRYHQVKETEFSFTLYASTVLTVDRIYIRKGNPEYNSITFLIPKQYNTIKYGNGKIRFWVKLKETENMEFEIYENK
jgi:hypothetical protein